jgi:hypothetical protein
MGGPCRLNGRAGADAAMADAREVASGKIRVPRTDVECLRDGAAPREPQRLMVAVTSCRFTSLCTDHSPLSAPEALCEQLHAVQVLPPP